VGGWVEFSASAGDVAEDDVFLSAAEGGDGARESALEVFLHVGHR